MRTSLVLSLSLAAALGGCDQSLTHDMTGTGGTGTGTGGSVPATGGTGGTIGAGGAGGSVSAVCDTLTAEYQSAFTAAETCEVGASGQCQQLYNGSLTGCHCPTYVNDGSALDAIESAWVAAGCAVPQRPCDLACPIAVATTCVSVDGGTLGYCSYVPGNGGTTGAGGAGATGGTTGAGGAAVDGGISACDSLSSEYAAVLAGAKSCTAGAGGQCAQLVPSRLGPCGDCGEYVNDSSVLDAIQQKWEATGCGDVNVACPLIDCSTPPASQCVPSDAGGSVCVAPTLAL